MPQRFVFFAPCTRGAERLLADELAALGVRGVRSVRAGASFVADLPTGYRVLLWSRLASRLLMRVAEVPAATADDLYGALLAVPWDEHMRADGTLSVDASGTNEALRNTQFTAVRVKDAVCDRFRERFGRRPSVDPRDPDLRINVAVRGEKATVSLDLAGEPLHRRGYRKQGEQVEAPLKETLAAAVLMFAGWTTDTTEARPFWDPLCGSGTLAIEAAMIAGDVAPGFLRRRWGFDRWLGHDSDAWAGLREEAADRREAGASRIGEFRASDADPRAVAIAEACVRRAGLDGRINIVRADIGQAAPPRGTGGLLAVNPPWGERLSDRSQLAPLYARIATAYGRAAAEWSLAVISPDPGVAAGVGAQPFATMELSSGPVTATVGVYRGELVPGTREGSASGQGGSAQGRREASVAGAQGAARAAGRGSIEIPSGQLEPFVNRLRKMDKHYSTWARRAGVSCFRVYDADLPDFAVAVDRYKGAGPDEGREWVHVAEYAAPAEVDEDRATARLDAAMQVIPEVLGVDPSTVFLKRRERQRGTAQYERVSKRGATGTVAEAGLLFEVNLSDYLDTGLFLDHRDTRAWVGGLSEGKSFLNLFAYTGTATVHAAAAGATSTTTVDLSATYLEWAARNMALNGFTGPEHVRVRADVTEWLRAPERSADSFDVIFCDPPTFSTSKRMDQTFDVQRDHVAVITHAARMLADGGVLVFSCNRRKFTLDSEALEQAGLSVRDVTARTIPKDFERRPRVHSCWTIEHAAR